MVINLIGLPGSGKSTIALELSKAFGYPVIRIGQFRNKKENQCTSINASEVFAWKDMASAIKKAGWDNCIIESSGINKRLQPILNNFNPLNLMTVKLVCSKRNLLRRCAKKVRTGFFPYSFDDVEFIKLHWKIMKRKPADVVVRTDRRSLKRIVYTIIEKCFSKYRV